MGKYDLIVARGETRDKARLEALLASIGEGVIAVDEHGQINRINKAGLDMLGYKKEDVIHKHFTTTIQAAHDDGTNIRTADRPVAKVFLFGKTVHQRTNYIRQDGSILPVQVTVSPILFQGSPIGAISIFRDLTLEIESDKMKSDFISVASHQLRTPLSAINIYTRMLEDGLAGEVNLQQKEFIKIILGSVDRMNELISTLLNITRIEAGGIAVRLQKTNLPEALREMLDEVRPAVEAKQQKLVSHIDEDVPEIQTDTLLVKEVYANLLSNAIKYTPNGGRIIVSLKQTENDIVFQVKDNGYGIPFAAQEYVFGKFFRASNAIVEETSGTGLGLYLTKTVVDSLEGEIWFKSVENKGSSFYFSLPKRGSIKKEGRFKLDD